MSTKNCQLVDVRLPVKATEAQLVPTQTQRGLLVVTLRYKQMEEGASESQA